MVEDDAQLTYNEVGVVYQVETLAAEQKGKAEGLRNTIIPLWERLEIPGVFREDFLAKHSGYKSWMIKEVGGCGQVDGQTVGLWIKKPKTSQFVFFFLSIFFCVLMFVFVCMM